MKLLRALVAGAALALILTGVASAHFVTPTCGAVTFNDTTAGWTAVVQPGDLVFGPFTHDGDNGPFKIAPGSYTYQFVDATGKDQESGDFTVTACDGPSSSPTHKPTPHATPPVTATDEVIVPSSADPWTIVLLVIGLTAICFGLQLRGKRR